MNARHVEAFEAYEAEQIELAEQAQEAQDKNAAAPVVLAIASILRADFTPAVAQHIVHALLKRVEHCTWVTTDKGELALFQLDNLHDDLEGAKT